MILPRRFRDRLDARDWRRPWRDPPGFFPGVCCEKHPDCTMCGSVSCQYLLSVGTMAGNNGTTDTCCSHFTGDWILYEAFSSASTDICDEGTLIFPAADGNCQWYSPWIIEPVKCGGGYDPSSEIGACIDQTITGSSVLGLNGWFRLVPALGMSPSSNPFTWHIEAWLHLCTTLDGGPPPPFPCNTCWDCYNTPANDCSNTTFVENIGAPIRLGNPSLSQFRARWVRTTTGGSCDITGTYTLQAAASSGAFHCSTVPSTVTLAEVTP